MQPCTRGGIHERVEAELIDLALQERVEPRLSQTEAHGNAGLGQSTLLNKFFDTDHDLRTQSEIARLIFRESKVPKHVIASSDHLDSLCHRFCLLRSSITARNRSLASPRSRFGVFRVFLLKA
jgi:hypothetical protein